MISSVWGFTSKALEKGTQVVSTVGTKVQQKLDEAGVTENVSYYVSTAAEGTKQIGSKIYEKGSEQLEYVSANPMVNDFTEKSKSALGTIGGAVTEITSVISEFLIFFSRSIRK